uniref:VWFA domain-containing protein n=1 Tax=Glossina brevipalpis TaxID=37001 RepID=A0A1A9WBW9_9MUSC
MLEKCTTLRRVITLTTVQATPEDEAVGKWATQFGDELWELAQRMTKSQEIKAKYKEYNARVELKNGTELIKYITANVGKMLARKMDAIKCILRKAESSYEEFEYNETYALNEFQYYSSKYSQFEGTKTLKAIMWTEELDEVFRQNYQADPALSWQYFGSDTGILRQYPASQWQEHDNSDNADTYDCRKRSWYIETATCSKDIVILLDNSGSMAGFRRHVGKFTIRSILDTFSNNDFFTVFNYSTGVDDLIPCFKGALVQATPENKNVFNDAISKMEPTGYANLSLAYEKAFQLLKKYYIQRRCNETSTCNQAIMLVTDGVAGNTTEIFEKYNWGNGENGTMNMRVRIFTYLLGKEVTKVREIQWMACLNRGYYSHVQTLDEVQEEALKYVDVIATPLVLQNIEHPPTWTHSFTDKSYVPGENATDTRLMIAVGIPAFDRSYLKPNSSAKARLLGVAGTDVPVEDIDKLTLPYKLGVNGYSFVVSNNGYVLLHPDLRPITTTGILNPNYNSVDLTEVEQLFEDNSPREPGSSILELRSAMVRHQTGEFKDLSVKLHYDKMRRVSEEKQDYFFAPLPNTPFSLGIVLPSEYGKTWIKVGEEVLRNVHMKVNISNFFVGENWKIHPDWVYCKYHYLEGHEFKTPEAELKHFLGKMVQKDWKWAEQYEDDEVDINCGRRTLNNDVYYCNKELVHLLIFDAKVTNSSYGQWKFENEEEKALIERFGGTLRFVATMSGLTRWQFIYGEVEIDTDREFGDYHTKAIDETWYKSAILQHHEERTESFVYSVKHAKDPDEDSDLKVTASHAIFPRDGGKEAPACVVGFQFSHALMLERFFNITSVDNCNGCIKTCDSDENECYVIDNNAYIILARNVNHTGKFFGEYQGDVMLAMLEKEIFQSIEVYDYQALCPTGPDQNTFTVIHIELAMASISVILVLFQYKMVVLEYLDEIEDDYEAVPDSFSGVQQKTKEINEEGELIFQEPEPPPVYINCDKQSTLFSLQPNSLEGINDYIKVPNSRPFYLKKIPNTNLLLVVVNVLMPSKGVRLTTEPQPIEYETEFPCYKLNMSFYERRRIEECYTEHPDEDFYTYCGKATSLNLNFVAFIMTLFIILLTWFICD